MEYVRISASYGVSNPACSKRRARYDHRREDSAQWRSALAEAERRWLASGPGAAVGLAPALASATARPGPSSASHGLNNSAAGIRALVLDVLRHASHRGFRSVQ